MGMSRSNAAEAGADAARHIPFQRNLTGDIAGRRDSGNGVQHALRAARVDGRPPLQLVQSPQQRLSHQSAFSKRTIFGGGITLDSQSLEFGDTKYVVPGPTTDKKPDL